MVSLRSCHEELWAGHLRTPRGMDGSGMSPSRLAKGAEVVQLPPPAPIDAPASSLSPQPRRLGLLQCPNAKSLGWAAGDAVATATSSSGNDGKPTKTEEPNASYPMATKNVSEINTGPIALKGDDTPESPCITAVAKNNDDNLDSTTAKNARSGKKQESEIGNDDVPPNNKRPRLAVFSPSVHPIIMSTRVVKENDQCLIDVSEKVSETEEVMKGADDCADTLTNEPTMNEAKQADLSVTLEYEPMNNESLNRCLILTITYQGGGSCAMKNSATVVGTISGRASLELLSPSLSESDHMKNITSRGTKLPFAISLDLFGYRIPQSFNQGNAKYSENQKSIIINRPDWMKSLPISIVCQHPNQAKVMPPTVFRLRIRSLTKENEIAVKPNSKRIMSGSKSGECYSNAHPEESYQLNILPPNLHYPGNYTAAGSGVCIIPEKWEVVLDKIKDSIENSEAKTIDNSLDKKTPVMDSNSRRRTALGNCDRILLCGAKGVGKSTLLRYATNRILSTPSCNASLSTISRDQHCSARVALLDLDCGQAELSPPGMLTLTIFSRPLLSDPPVHMVCGGSCDHCGQRIDSGKGQDQRKGDSKEHEAAYFFGDVTSKADPDTYIQMASQLMCRYDELRKRQGFSSLPLLVNTDGWVKGLGFEILSAIIRVVNPGHILQIMGSTNAKSFDMSSHFGDPIVSSVDNEQCFLRKRLVHVIQAFEESLLPACDNDNKSHRLMDSCSSIGPPLASASDHRAYRLCTYFLGGYGNMIGLSSETPGEKELISFHKERGLDDPNSIAGVSLASMLPYAVPFHSVQVYPPPGLIDGISELRLFWGVQGDSICSDILGCLNGSIVGLCCKPDAFDTPLSNCNAGTGVPILNCVGLGILRSVDYIHKIFFVLTPVHPRLLQNVTAFVGGNIHLSIECLCRGVHSDSFPHLSFGHTLTNTSLGANLLKSHNRLRGKR